MFFCRSIVPIVRNQAGTLKLNCVEAQRKNPVLMLCSAEKVWALAIAFAAKRYQAEWQLLGRLTNQEEDM